MSLGYDHQGSLTVVVHQVYMRIVKIQLYLDVKTNAILTILSFHCQVEAFTLLIHLASSCQVKKGQYTKRVHNEIGAYVEAPQAPSSR